MGGGRWGGRVVCVIHLQVSLLRFMFFFVFFFTEWVILGWEGRPNVLVLGAYC